MARPKTKTGQQRKRRPVVHLCGSADDGGIGICFLFCDNCNLIILMERSTSLCLFNMHDDWSWEKEMNNLNRVCVWIMLNH